MRRYEWLLIALLVVSGLFCLAAVGGAVWGADEPVGLFSSFARWAEGRVAYLLIGLGVLWVWAVWGLVSGTGRARSESCRVCGMGVERGWYVCPFCGEALSDPTRIAKKRTASR